MATGQVLASVRLRGDLKDVLSLVAPDLVRLESLLDEHCRSNVVLLGEMARYVKDGGGKRVRPALLLLAAGLVGGGVSDRALQLAAAVEFIHSATLVHDDIIDNAPLRRGRRTASRRWGNDVTVLLGDFLYTQSMALALTTENLPILRLLSDVTLRMIEGEVQEIERCGDAEVSEADHLDLIKRKTADLFSACARIGALVGGADEERERALASYGLNLGICFQMVDDLLDFTGNEALLGKPVANDLREGKVTLPAIFLLQRGGPAVRERVNTVLTDRGFGQVTRDEIVRLAREAGALDEAQRLAATYAAAAKAALAPFEPSPHRAALASIPDFVLDRQY
jgi:octaprenyl-diphosphate synthase